MRIFSRSLLFCAAFPWAGLGFIILISACSKNQAKPTVETVNTREEDPYSYDLEPVLHNIDHAQFVTSVSLPGARTPLQVYTRQLTDRAAEEQIAISRHPERGNLELFLISPRVVSSVEGSVADYRIVAQEELNIDSETFAVQTQDLTGDGRTHEIFVSGKNTVNGLEQVYVFQLLLSGTEQDVIGLLRIFYQEGSGSYEISFSNKGYYIVHQRLLDQSNYRLELTDLQWSASARSFVVRKVETIDNSDKLSDNLKAVYRGGAEDFFSVLDGLWLYSNEGTEGGAEETVADMFLYFDSEMNELLIYADTVGLQKNDQVIEVYHITNMIKSLWNRLTLNTRNKYVYNMQRYFYVTLEDKDTIRLFSLNDSSYAGSYKRMNAVDYRNYEQQSMGDIGAGEFQLEGIFAEQADGRQYTFQPNQLTLSEPGGKTWVGAYSFFSWRGSNYLEFRLFEFNSVEAYQRSYRVERGEDAESDIFVLLLYPVQLLRVEEINNTSENIIRLEQKIGNREPENLLPGS